MDTPSDDRPAPTPRQARLALLGGAVSNLAMVALVQLTVRGSLWGVLALLAFVSGIGVALLLGRMPPPASPREVSHAVGVARVPSVVVVVYLLLEVAAVGSIGWAILDAVRADFS